MLKIAPKMDPCSILPLRIGASEERDSFKTSSNKANTEPKAIQSS